MKEHKKEAQIVPITRKNNNAKIILKGIKNYIETTKDIIKDIKSELYLAKNSSAMCDVNNHVIKVFLDELTKKSSINEEYRLWNLIVTAYHEYQHLDLDEIIFEKPITDNNSLYLKTEMLINTTDGFYVEYHDCFLKEILANKYGYMRAKEFLKKRYPEIYKHLKITIYLSEILHDIYQKNYDLNPFLTKADEDIKKILKEVEIKSMILGSGMELIQLLYNQDGTLKPLNVLSKEEDWIKLPETLKYQIIASDIYLDSINYKKVSKETLTSLLEAITYCIKLENKKTEFNNEIRKKINYLNNKICEDNTYGADYYLQTLLVLNRKEKVNKNRLTKLNEQKEKIIISKKEKEKSIKRKTLTK